jgi:hypothetical protein
MIITNWDKFMLHKINVQGVTIAILHFLYIIIFFNKKLDFGCKTNHFTNKKNNLLWKISLIAVMLLFLKRFSQGPRLWCRNEIQFEDGSKYLRVISWAQIWGQYNLWSSLDGNGNEQADLDFSVRRARVLLYAQINKDFLILTYIGLIEFQHNEPYRNRRRVSSVLHDVWAQYSLGKNNAVGGGLHYWNGIVWTTKAL